MERIKENIPIISSSLVLLGVSKLFFFYNYFDINIIPYLSFSEIITSFLDDIIYLIILFTFLTFQLSIGNILKMFTGFDKEYKELINIKSKKSKLTAFIVSLVIFIVFCFYFWLKPNNIWVEYFTLFYGYAFMATCLDILFKESIKCEVVMLILLLWSISVLTFSEIRNVFTSNISYIITIENQDIKIEGMKKFIGKTESFFFYRDFENNTNIIYPMDVIEKIKITYK
ncbi:hypothetical protein AXE80_06850 [Wenyingzhuangia fucanilytica]|uniref:Uncharacterized protein n=1 Tax=Wenyingzhuangia fucanilytica TaxID=1790137 RepID=A0A1B1Y5F9_9FLAO|nr:hypothetical protein [Wenyingzhuangia fucanilytica]ANW96016.1 hypothetical protein AXE80_06850 [Wenyingzhuangia fucanilytica]